MVTTITPAQWLGLDAADIDFTSLERPVHHALLEPWAKLREEAAVAGFDLALASGYRDFHRQAAIWNAKARGERAVHDDQGRPVAVLALEPAARLEAIWRYSALPGTSRHHWGTDVDVYDRGAVPEDYVLQLTPGEYAPGGPFAALSNWLEERMQSGRSAGFFRPYRVDRGGIAPEPWHLSYAPLARQYEVKQVPAELAHWLRVENVMLSEVVLARLDHYWLRYVQLPQTEFPVT